MQGPTQKEKQENNNNEKHKTEGRLQTAKFLEISLLKIIFCNIWFI